MAIYTAPSGRKMDIYPMLSGREKRRVNKSYEMFLDVIIQKKLAEVIKQR